MLEFGIVITVVVLAALAIALVEVNVHREKWKTHSLDLEEGGRNLRNYLSKARQDLETEKQRKDENCVRIRKQNNVLTVQNQQLRGELEQRLSRQHVTPFFEGLEKLLPILNNNCKVTITRTGEKLAS